MRLLILSFCIVFSTSAVAQNWAERQGDVVLSMEEITDLISGKVLGYYDDGQSSYRADGGYRYTFASGETADGRFTVKEDGLVCVTFENGRSRCDRFVSSGGRMTLLTAQGDRFPVKP